MMYSEENRRLLAVVAAWVEKYGISYEWGKSDDVTIEFAYNLEGYMYSATAYIHQNEDEVKIRVCVVLEMTKKVDELILYRHINDLQLHIPSGALAFISEIGVVVHREDFLPDDEVTDESVEDFGYTLQSSHLAFCALREVLAEYFGESAADARLSAMLVAGSA